jgi:hypothetical protein
VPQELECLGAQSRGDEEDAISIIGELAAILTAAGVSIYVLGLIGLAIPIRREFTQDLSTAWYAVALIPKTVVAGQGARI